MSWIMMVLDSTHCLMTARTHARTLARIHARTHALPVKANIDTTFEICKEKCTELGEEGCAGVYLFKTTSGAPKCNGMKVLTKRNDGTYACCVLRCNRPATLFLRRQPLMQPTESSCPTVPKLIVSACEYTNRTQPRELLSRVHFGIACAAPKTT